MAKKSKAKKRRQKQKTAQMHKNTTEQKETLQTVPEEATEQEKAIEAETIDEMASEPVPRERISSRMVAILLIIIIVLLLIVVAVMYQSINSAKQDVVNNQGQSELLQVVPGAGDSLQPNTTTNPQQSSSPESTAGANDVQPQQQVTPGQLNQLQQ